MTARLQPPELRSNIRHLYADIFWFGILAGSTLAFLAVYATRLGGTGFQISLLTAGPAVVNLLISLPAGRWLEGRPLIGASFWSAALHRAWYLALIPLPWLFADKLQIWVAVLITLLMSIPGTLLAIGFNAMFANVVPADWRADVVGRRNALMAVSLSVTTLICGQLLDLISFPLNYQIVFGIGAVGAIMSTYHVGRIRTAEELPLLRAPGSIGRFASPGLLRIGILLRMPAGIRFITRPKGKPLLRLDLLRGPFGLFLTAYLLFYVFQFIGIPLFPLFNVRELELRDSAISLGSALFHAVMFLVSLQISRLTTRYGHKRVMVLGGLLFSLYPLLIGLARDATLFWIASLIGGGVWALVSAGMMNRLMEKAPEDDRPAYMALHNLALNLGVLTGSLAGPLATHWIGLREAILVSAGLRFLAGVLLAVWG